MNTCIALWLLFKVLIAIYASWKIMKSNELDKETFVYGLTLLIVVSN